MKKLVVNLVCAFIPSKKIRGLIREKVLFPPVVFNSNPACTNLPVAIAFCFDGAYWKHAAVSIHSLLQNSIGRCHYDIFCVVSEDISVDIRKKIEKQVLSIDGLSSIRFLSPNKDFLGADIDAWSAANKARRSIVTYHRLMLPKLLPQLDKVIYADTDVLFCNSLAEVWLADLDDNLLAGVKDDGSPDEINAGFLIMNLKAIRKTKLYRQWRKMAVEKSVGADQRILNETCKGRILLLPRGYNFVPGIYWAALRDGRTGRYNDNITMIHYIFSKAWRKPYAPYARFWWKYAKMSGLF